MSLEVFHRKKPLPLTPEGATTLSNWLKGGADLSVLTEKYFVGIAHFLLNEHNGWTPLHTAAQQGLLAQVAKVLEPSGISLDPEHFLYKDSSDWTVLHAATAMCHLHQVVAVLKASGQHLPGDYFLIRDKNGSTPLQFAAMANQLDHVFTPSHWIGQIGQMEKLWEQVSPTKRGRFDYASARAEAMWLSVQAGGKIPGGDFKGARRSVGENPGKDDASQGHERN